MSRAAVGQTVPALLLALACAKNVPPRPFPAASASVAVARLAGPGDSASPRVSAAGQYAVVRGLATIPPGAGLYGDLDLSSPPTLRLTLYDSVPGRPLAVMPPSQSAARRRVVYEARIGPLSPGDYEVTVGRYDAASRLIVEEARAQQVRLRPAGP